MLIMICCRQVQSSGVSWGRDGSAMLNPTNGDPSHVVVNYVEEYLDLVESLPFDLQRSVSLMKEIDARYQGKEDTDLFSNIRNSIRKRLQKPCNNRHHIVSHLFCR